MNADPSPAPELPPGLPAGAVVDLDAIRHNVEVLRHRAGSAAVMAVVKADGYGHGLLPSARAALAGGAAWLGVARLTEALALRAAGIEAPVLAWLSVPGDVHPAAVAARVDIGISAGWALSEVAAAAESTGRPARVHLKIDTGLNRNGIGPDEWPDLVDAAVKLQAEGLLELVGVFSHYACADEPDHPSVAAQTAAFTAAVELATERGARFQVRHLANSAALLTNPASHFDLVRPGVSIYGLNPVPDHLDSGDLGLRPAMTLLARVANVKRVPAGQGIAYGHSYVTARPTTVALLPLGYADGLPRHAGNAGPVLLAGVRRTVSGRVSMDQITVDLALDNQHNPADQAEPLDPGATGGRPDVQPGDVAVLFGAGPAAPRADDWAEAAGTIGYEIVARIGARVPRIHIGRAGREDVAEGGPGHG